MPDVALIRDEVWGTDKQGNPVLLDPGVFDKRLMITEPEFTSVLAMMKHEGSTLSAILRKTWDKPNLRT